MYDGRRAGIIFRIIVYTRWRTYLLSVVSFAKEPYKRDDILQKRPRILRILLTVATAYQCRQRAVSVLWET